MVAIDSRSSPQPSVASARAVRPEFDGGNHPGTLISDAVGLLSLVASSAIWSDEAWFETGKGVWPKTGATVEATRTAVIHGAIFMVLPCSIGMAAEEDTVGDEEDELLVITRRRGRVKETWA